MNNENVCGLCSIKTDDYVDIFRENGKSLRIADIISLHFWFKVTEEDKLADFDIICNQCWSRLSDFHTFYTDIEKVHCHGPYSMEVVKVEVDGDPHNFDIFIDDSKIDEDLNTETIDDDITDIINVDDPKNRKIKTRNKKLKSKDNELRVTKKTVYLMCREKKKLEREKQNLYFRSFFTMDCEICNEQLLTFNEVQAHYQTVHNQQGYAKCCTRKFFSQRAMKDHISEHVDPKSLKCDYCQKGYTLKTSLRYHLLTHIDTDKRPFKCDECGRTFIKQRLLTQHQKIRHSNNDDKEFGCDDCEKRFISQYLLQSHITQAHGLKNSFICDVCAKGFSTYSNCMSHKKIVHDKVMPQVQCEVCGTWLTNSYNLKKHMKIHTDGKQTCQYCFRVLKNRRTLRKHCGELHSDRKLLKCNLCGKEYRRATNLQEHMATHTGSELYSCSFCPTTFNSSTNMYKHRKNRHPEEYRQLKESSGRGNMNSTVPLPPISNININREYNRYIGNPKEEITLEEELIMEINYQ